MSNDDKFLNKVESAKKTILDYKRWLGSNQLDFNEDSVVYIDDKKKIFGAGYSSDEGKFTISIVDKGINSKLTAESEFGDLKFKATITKSGINKDGTPPVFNEHWSKFHTVFVPSDKLSE